MHIEARNFTIFVKSVLPDYFKNKLVLDVGGGDINGNNRFLFNDCTVHVNDVCQSSNVTIISRTKNLPFQNNTFDTIISTECFEHDPEYKDSILKIYDMLKPDGLFLFTCASTGRMEHGTRKTSPQDSYGSIVGENDMQDYYKNLTKKDIIEIFDNKIEKNFKQYEFYYNESSKDLYFWGIKYGNDENYNHTISPISIPTFKDPFVIKTGSSHFYMTLSKDDMTGLCNQIYALTGCIEYCIMNSIKKLVVSRLLKEIKTNDKCLLSEVIDIKNFNIFLMNYDIQIVDVDERLYTNTDFLISPILYMGNSKNNILYTNILNNIRFLDFYSNIAKNNIYSNEINVIHLRLEEDALDIFSREMGIHRDVYKFINEHRYIECIKEYIDKSVMTIVIGSKNNRVIDFLRENKYIFMATNKIFDKREINAVIDLNIGFECNKVFIGSFDSTFSYTIMCRLLKKDIFCCLIDMNKYTDSHKIYKNEK